MPRSIVLAPVASFGPWQGADRRAERARERARCDGGCSDDETNLITLCTECHHKIHERQMNGDYSHSELVKTGIALARAEDTRWGRHPTVTGDEAKVNAIRAARAAGKSIRAIAREFGVGVGSVQRLIAS